MIRIRIDDFPICIPGTDPAVAKRNLRAMFRVLSASPVPYIFGAIPYCCDDEWMSFVKDNMAANGALCMHGFTHLHDRWSGYSLTFQDGGEFAGMSVTDCANAYDSGADRLRHSANFDQSHFIAPFNNYTQALVDALNMRGVRYLHTCDKEWNNYGYAKLDYGAITPVIGRLYKDYHFARKIIQWLDHGGKTEWVTLHWHYEFRHFGDGWLHDLETLCRRCVDA
jgi:hypothetical protein